ncbi:hypothetical protein P7K49_012883, partial [Saguinus oedipus]
MHWEHCPSVQGHHCPANIPISLPEHLASWGYGQPATLQPKEQLISQCQELMQLWPEWLLATRECCLPLPPEAGSLGSRNKPSKRLGIRACASASASEDSPV